MIRIFSPGHTVVKVSELVKVLELGRLSLFRRSSDKQSNCSFSWAVIQDVNNCSQHCSNTTQRMYTFYMYTVPGNHQRSRYSTVWNLWISVTSESWVLTHRFSLPDSQAIQLFVTPSVTIDWHRLQYVQYERSPPPKFHVDSGTSLHKFSNLYFFSTLFRQCTSKNGPLRFCTKKIAGMFTGR
jgi:hypothetical protein